MADRPALKVIEGGEVAEDLSGIPRDVLETRLLRVESLNAGLLRTVREAEDEHATDRARIAGLKGQISKWNRQATPDDLVEPILWRWKNTCRGPNSRVEITVEGKRADVVRKTIARLVKGDQDPELANPDKEKRQAAVESAQERAAAAINEAIDGAAAFPFRDKYGRVAAAEPGPGLYRCNDLTDILRDEKTLEKFRRLHDERMNDAAAACRADLHRRLRTQPNLRAVLASFDPEHSEILARAIRWCQTQERPS